MSQSHPGSTNIAVSHTDLPALDCIVGAALASGYRPGGKRPSRGTVVADLIRRAATALHQGGPQQPPGAALGLQAASDAPAQQDAPQSPADASRDTLPEVPPLPVAPAPRPRTYAPHYFAVHGGTEHGEVR